MFCWCMLRVIQAKNNDKTLIFPMTLSANMDSFFRKNAITDNWLEVGALSFKPGEDMVAGLAITEENVNLSRQVYNLCNHPNDQYQ